MRAVKPAIRALMEKSRFLIGTQFATNKNLIPFATLVRDQLHPCPRPLLERRLCVQGGLIDKRVG